MTYDQRQRYGNDDSSREDLVESLARLHRVDVEVARDLLDEAERAAIGDPYARSVREWFGILADQAHVAEVVPGKRTVVGRALDGRGRRQSNPIPGRVTRTM